MRDRLTEEEAGAIKLAASERRHGNGKPWRHATRDLMVLCGLLAGMRPENLARAHALTAGQVARILAGYARRAGIRRSVTPTMCRSYAARAVWARTGSLAAVGRTLGVSPRQAAVYLSPELLGESPAAVN